MPSDHRLERLHCVDVRQLASDVFISASNIGGPMRGAIEAYLAANKLDLEPTHRVHNLTMAMSLIASTRGIAHLPGPISPVGGILPDRSDGA
jgi:LysR family transcriptional regulator, hca operon transcriptional activator